MTPLGDGLRIVVILNGRMSMQAGDRPPINISNPTVCAVLTTEEHSRDQVFEPGEPYRFALVHLDPALVCSELGVDPFSLLQDHASSNEARRLVVAARPAEPAVQSVASQIIACPRTQTHNLYLLAKALELTALALEGFRGADTPGKNRRLSLSDIERIRAARDLLVESLTEPPQLSDLAHKVGLNVGKLNRGFRSSYGMTPYAYLQEYRLQIAYHQLSSRGVGVGEVAYQVGYSPAHFATLFRKRFGVSPSELIGRSGPGW
jgi:AraC family transcriptional regulator, transcriptional activator of the genes for pyochelin and ferripyochelin receptors